MSIGTDHRMRTWLRDGGDMWDLEVVRRPWGNRVSARSRM